MTNLGSELALEGIVAVHAVSSSLKRTRGAVSIACTRRSDPEGGRELVGIEPAM